MAVYILRVIVLKLQLGYEAITVTQVYAMGFSCDIDGIYGKVFG